ncbi:MAG: glycosyltransferase family 39 protein [Limisphaerales bacterium]
MLLVVNLATMVFVFLLGREMFGVIAGLVACASYGLMSTSPAVVGLAAHATQFVVLFAVPGTLLLWRAGQSGRQGTIFFSGLLYGLAFVMKQPGWYFPFLDCSLSFGANGAGHRAIR